jgi:hypothetical protein
MTSVEDWSWKLREAIDRIKSRYEHIGRKTGAPFLAIVYPPEAETAVLKEWHTLLASLGPEFEVKQIDVLAVTMAVVEDLGGENIVGAMADPMPGSNPEAELGHMWANAVATAVRESARQKTAPKAVVVLERLAALYPATGPRAVMQALWDSEQSSLDGPVVVLIPGRIEEPRVYAFVNQQPELMYRGDIL